MYRLKQARVDMIARQLKIIALLLAATIASTWVLYRLNLESTLQDSAKQEAPDYFMEDFTTLAMNETGQPDYKLYAIYMAHYPENDTTEIVQPKIEVYRPDRPPLMVNADKGWLTADNDVVLLNGNVEISEKNHSGKQVLLINTDKMRLLINQNYAETDDFASIRAGRTLITGTGMHANLNEGKLTVLSDVRTVITPR